MLFLPQIEGIAAGVAWYGFPHSGNPAALDLVDDLSVPIAIIHGSADRPSPIGRIYEYASALDRANKYYELKVYQGEPHRFMVSSTSVVESPAARDAFASMLSFWDRML